MSKKIAWLAFGIVVGALIGKYGVPIIGRITGIGPMGIIPGAIVGAAFGLIYGRKKKSKGKNESENGQPQGKKKQRKTNTQARKQ